MNLHKKKIIFGSIRYILANPVVSWPILCQRLRCVFTDRVGPTLTPEGFVIWHRTHYYTYCNIFVERFLDHPRWIKEMKEHKEPLVLDIGANIGMFGQYCAEINALATIIGFEPCVEYCVEWNRIQKERSFRGEVLNTALSNEDGMSTHTFADYMGKGIRSVLGQGGDRLSCYKLDTILPRIQPSLSQVFLIKIDTDGSNTKILEGATETLGKTQFVLIEKEDEEDYTPFFQGWKRYDLQADILYENIHKSVY